MTNENADVNLISHLLDVEKEAALQTKAAQDEANKIISQSHADADNSFNEQYTALIKDIDDDYAQRKNEIEDEYKKTLAEYKSEVENRPQYKDNFFAFLQKTVQIA